MTSNRKVNQETQGLDNVSKAVTQEVRIIELTGQKLDPNAKYLFVIHEAGMTGEELDRLYSQLDNMIGRHRYAVSLTYMPVAETLKVYEIMPQGPTADGNVVQSVTITDEDGVKQTYGPNDILCSHCGHLLAYDGEEEKNTCRHGLADPDELIFFCGGIDDEGGHDQGIRAWVYAFLQENRHKRLPETLPNNQSSKLAEGEVS